MYEILNISYATVTELFEMFDAKLDGIVDQLTFLKHFQRPWVLKQILANLSSVKTSTILSIGEGYDIAAGILSNKYKAKVYVLDKYEKDEVLDESRYDWGITVEDLKKKNPEVTYVYGLAGMPALHLLGDNMFDCIYSNSVLEHIPHENFGDAIDDMDRMLKRNGIQVHAIDFPIDLYLELLQFYKEKIGQFVLRDHRSKLDEIDTVKIRANPMTFYEPVDSFKRWWFPMRERKDVKYERWTSLNIVLKKIS